MKHPWKSKLPDSPIEEVSEVTEAFPSLARLSAESESAWLVQRPGLIDLLLRSDAIASLSDGALSEADVFAAVWHRLVRRSERSELGRGSPDGREKALIAIARNLLVFTTPSSERSLRAALVAIGRTSVVTGVDFSMESRQSIRDRSHS